MTGLEVGVRGDGRQNGRTGPGPLIEGRLVVRPPSWRRRAARWVYAGSRRAAQTWGLKGLILRLFAAATILAIASVAILWAALVLSA